MMMMMMMKMMAMMYDRKRTAWPAKCPRQSITYQPALVPPTVTRKNHKIKKRHNNQIQIKQKDKYTQKQPHTSPLEPSAIHNSTKITRIKKTNPKQKQKQIPMKTNAELVLVPPKVICLLLCCSTWLVLVKSIFTHQPTNSPNSRYCST